MFKKSELFPLEDFQSHYRNVNDRTVEIRSTKPLDGDYVIEYDNPMTGEFHSVKDSILEVGIQRILKLLK